MPRPGRTGPAPSDDITASAEKRPTPPPGSRWYARGRGADWYLAPLRGGKNDGFGFMDAYFELTGAPRVLPRHGFGFMATYW